MSLTPSAELSLSRGEPDWSLFKANPLRFVHSKHVAECFSEWGKNSIVASIQAEQRFQSRLERLFQDHFGLPSLADVEQPLAQDLPIALLEPEHFASLALPCGVVLHARSFTQEIRASVLRSLKARFGEGLFALALANTRLSRTDRVITDIDELERAVWHDGEACVAAWLAVQPTSLAAWLRLKGRDEPVFSRAFSADLLEQGPVIVRCVAPHIHEYAVMRKAS
jgi:hypothetical protein